MADTPWTKGPWVAVFDDSEGDDFSWHVEQDRGGQSVAAMYPFAGGSTIDGEANARLIAAAPDMAEALTLLVEEYCDYMRLNNLGDCEKQYNIKLARAALAKARGEQ